MSLRPDAPPAPPGPAGAPGLSPRGAAASLAGAMLLVGAYVGAAPLLLAWFPVAVLAGLRFAVAALAMLPWLRRDRKSVV